MSDLANILVVDDTAVNRKMLSAILSAQGFVVSTAGSGPEALDIVATREPDLILLDVVMPVMDGYEVCRRIKQMTADRVLPVVLVTSLKEQEERTRGLDAGADDFLTKPINHAELLARVRSLLRIKGLYDQVQRQAQELTQWSQTLESRVSAQVQEMERLSQLKRFFSPQVAELILSGSTDDPLKTRRREIAVVFLDLRGFTAFAEVSDPEDVMRVLNEYHAAMGELVMSHRATLERFAGDGMMIFLNDPVEIPDPARSAVAMAVEMQQQFAQMEIQWRRRGVDLSLGIGLSQGYATLGAIGYEGRRDYGAIGVVTNLAARLCGESGPGQILISQRAHGLIEDKFTTRDAGEFLLKGFHAPVSAYTVEWGSESDKSSLGNESA